MASLRTLTDVLAENRTPVRLLVPKLLKSRDDWKSKCRQRRDQNKALQIKVRDLAASREAWRSKFEGRLAEQEPLRAERDALRARVDALGRELADAQKKQVPPNRSPCRAAGSTRSRPSRWPSDS